ncbi:Arc family DNA-binding protein [Escherichia coli]|nr:Arc family DNA-binding protein [Escherichia coli]
MARDDPHFNFRMPLEVREKLKLRAEANGRSMNSELLQIVQDALSKPSPIAGYRDDAERIADEQSELVRKMVFDTLKDLYKNPPDGGFY